MNIKKMYSVLVTSCVFGLVAITGVSYAEGGGVADNYVVTQEISWQQSPFGPKVWAVDGDFTKGSHITYIKFNAGDKTPLHTHTADYVGIVVTGTTRHYIPGKDASYKILPPGSHWSMEANVEHVSECLPGVECVMAVYQKKPFDFIAKKVAEK